MDRSRKIFEVNVDTTRRSFVIKEWRENGEEEEFDEFDSVSGSSNFRQGGGVKGEGKVGVKERAEFVRKQERRVSSYPTNVKRKTIDAEEEARSRA